MSDARNRFIQRAAVIRLTGESWPPISTRDSLVVAMSMTATGITALTNILERPSELSDTARGEARRRVSEVRSSALELFEWLLPVVRQPVN